MKNSGSNDPVGLLSPMELMGALSGRLIHDLSNHLSVISGNAQFAQMLSDDPEKVARAVQAVIKASTAAGNAIGACSHYRRRLYTSQPSMKASELEDAIEFAVQGWPEWDCDVPSSLSGTIAFDSRWVAHSIRQLLELVDAHEGNIEVSRVRFADLPECPGRKFRGCPAPELIEIKLTYRAEETIDFNQAKKAFAQVPLLAAYEMIHGCGGWIDSYSPEEGEQVIAIYLPLEDVPEMEEPALAEKTPA